MLLSIDRFEQPGSSRKAITGASSKVPRTPLQRQAKNSAHVGMLTPESRSSGRAGSPDLSGKPAASNCRHKTLPTAVFQMHTPEQQRDVDCHEPNAPKYDA